MKKPISLILLICILLSCVSLCACSLQVIIDKIIPTTAAEPKEEPLKIIETTMTDKNGKEFIISHSDNFTQDDLDFVAMWNGIRQGGYNIYYTMTELGEAIYECQADKGLLMLARFENPYVICGYRKENTDEYIKGEDGYNYSNMSSYVWCKFEKPTDTLETYEGMDQSEYTYILYDCVLTEDIVSSTQYNKCFKYYKKYAGEITLKQVWEEMLIYLSNETISNNVSKFISYLKPYKIFTSENNEKNVIFYGERYLVGNNGTMSLTNNYAKSMLGIYYGILSPHFNYFEEFDYEFVDQNKTYLDRHISLNIETLVDAVFDK